MRARTMCAIALAIGIGQTACAAHGTHGISPLGGAPKSWRYEVVVLGGGQELTVDGWLPTRIALADLVVRRGAETFVQEVQVAAQVDDEEWRNVPRHDGGFSCPRVRPWLSYSLQVRVGRRGNTDARHRQRGHSLVHDARSKPHHPLWLLHPALPPRGTRYRLRVHSEPGIRFETGVFAVDDDLPGTYEADASNIGVAPYATLARCAFGGSPSSKGAQSTLPLRPGRTTSPMMPSPCGPCVALGRWRAFWAASPSSG